MSKYDEGIEVTRSEAMGDWLDELGPEECLRYGGRTPCRGPMQQRYSTLGAEIIECEKHHDESIKRLEEIGRDYPDSPNPPAWFDPTYAGERWDDDY